ncbi:MAG: carbon monoxide dehydrogenase maturation protein [Candidatus Abyssobacteria bacterium SURF_5]|uniref:Carbon monoxide dehydrogenase maturation protein n=1 Tax=Abyssobacteria bacterium (strain SURF_5) TaxID=2093360 RepID=A0A3A4NF93_ABYX5|nr:MAG: carbon monoxide dehydrogenase maturation protein [Candidatus Abyssubacteria bacterium SURF_5]
MNVPQRKRLIAACGKGGSGKTALTALLTKYYLQNRQGKLLVIDADPTMCLPATVGVQPSMTVNDVREKIIREARAAGPKEKQSIARSLDYLLLEALIETDSFSMLVMGRPESLGCYCPVNDLLREGIKGMAAYFDIILIDGEAGVEQISRQVIRSVDVPLIVSDVSARGLQTATLIREVIESHKIIQYKKIGLVLNRVRNQSHARALAQQTGLELLACIPEDESVAAFDMQGRPLLQLPDDSPAYVAVRDMLAGNSF